MVGLVAFVPVRWAGYPVPVAVCTADGTILLANPALAAEVGIPMGRLRERFMLDLFRPVEDGQVHRIVEAVRLRRRSRSPIAVRWEAADGGEPYGELTVDPVADTAELTPSLLVVLRVSGGEPARAERAVAADASPTEARILALLAGGATTAQTARELGVTVDGVNYHLRRLSARWDVPTRTALVACAYVRGVLLTGVWLPVVAVL